MVGIGIVGIGFMGMIHTLAAKRLDGGRVVAICSRDPHKRAGDWTGIRGNFGPPGTHMDLAGITAYAQFEDLLADPNVNLVDLCVPNDEHARLAIRAMEAGKDVLVEKPIALRLDEADAMLAAAEASGRRLMVAHVLPFFPEFAFALDAVRSGRYGPLLAAHLDRVISRPDWSGGIASADRSGGPAIDLHIHDTHFVTLLSGVPRSVHSRGVQQDGAVTYLTTQYLYEDSAAVISATSGAISQKGREFCHGYEIYFERATLSFRFSAFADAPAVSPLAVSLPDGMVQRPDLGAGDPIAAFTSEMSLAVGMIGGDAPCEPDRLSGLLGRQALAVCLAEIQSVRSGSEVTIS